MKQDIKIDKKSVLKRYPVCVVSCKNPDAISSWKMAERQYAIKKIELLDVQDLTTALYDYNVPHDIVKIFANRDLCGRQLLQLNAGDVLQWRRQMRITEFNQVRKVIESIQQKPEDFALKALKTSYKKPSPPNRFERQVEARKPIPQPRPTVSSPQLPLPPYTFPKQELTQDKDVVSSDTDVDSFSDSDTQEQDYISNKDDRKIFQQPGAIATAIARIAIKERTFASDQEAVEVKDSTPRKGIYGHSAFNFNKPLPKIPSPVNDVKLQSAYETKDKQARDERFSVVKPKLKEPDVVVNNRTPCKTNDKKENVKGFLNVTSREAKEIMKKHGSGAYLIRPSTTFHCTLVVKHEGHVYNVGITYEPLEKLFKCASNNSCKNGFATLLELIGYFKDHPLHLQVEGGGGGISKVFLKEPISGK